MSVNFISSNSSNHLHLILNDSSRPSFQPDFKTGVPSIYLLTMALLMLIHHRLSWYSKRWRIKPNTPEVSFNVLWVFFLSSVECRACWLLDKDSSHCISDILQTVKPWRPFHFLTPYWSVSVFPLILTPFQSYNLNLTCCLTYSSTTWECAMEVKCLIQRKWLGCLQMTAVCGLHSWSVFCLTLSLQVKYYLWPFSRTLQRIMVANYTINRDRYPKKTIWNAIDDQLDSLRPKSLRERYAYVLFIFSGVHLSFDFDCLMSSPLYILCIGCWSQSNLLQWYIDSPWSRYWNKTAPTISTTARRRCQCHEHAIWLQRNHERGHLPVGVDLDTTNYYCTFLNSDKLVRCRTNFHPSLFCFSF